VRVAGLGPEVGHEERLLERDRRRHDLAVDRLQGLVLDRALVLRAHLSHDRVLALRNVDLAAGLPLDLADLRRQRQALVDEFDQLAVEGVDLLPQWA